MNSFLAAYRGCAIVVVALSMAPASAEIFKCKDGGKTIYQDQPCPGAGSALVVDTTPSVSGNTDAKGAQESLERLKANVSELEWARKKRENADEIDRLEREIRGYQRTEEEELAVLRSKKDDPFSLPPSAAAEGKQPAQYFAAEMQAVTEKYRLRKVAANNRIAQLRKESAGPPPPPPR
jgi:hypothetical protein